VYAAYGTRRLIEHGKVTTMSDGCTATKGKYNSVQHKSVVSWH